MTSGTLARISHTTLAQFPDFVAPVGDFSGLRALAWRALAAELLDIFMVGKVCSCEPWVMPPEFGVAAARVNRVSRARSRQRGVRRQVPRPALSGNPMPSRS